MLFPESASKAIAKTFYDKRIEVLSDTVERDEEGGVVRKGQTIEAEFFGNVRFNDLGEVMTELGLSESIDICVTCAVSAPISLDDMFRYDGKIYIATNVVPSDSHLTLTGKLWASQ